MDATLDPSSLQHYCSQRGTDTLKVPLRIPHLRAPIVEPSPASKSRFSHDMSL